MENQPINRLGNPIESIGFALQGLEMRSKAIAGNIANVNTPGYKRKVVNFEDILQDKTFKDVEMRSTDSSHIITGTDSNKPIVISEEQSFNVDSNSIDIDKEMVELSKTGLRFKALSALAKKQFDQMKGIIRG
ncbi:MAG: flagellar basal body rod protein FlgB [Cyanobacteria bacterium]|nr:flagellar basal body rod protein FlgB [Cyanobacteriota bacterium]MDA1021293.1 flagellar basal body rod protein FlgB [Cyanobacteriota bacterium]